MVKRTINTAIKAEKELEHLASETNKNQGDSHEIKEAIKLSEKAVDIIARETEKWGKLAANKIKEYSKEIEL